ncbi:MAG TPA: UbiA-like polyprenyltransferase [Terracidiphilus sp.]|jgi:4-hydroxybenzoate polyprenyltransferase|nr:UbiA-like polyprenyltransferase [Terracidiphilus sp.]
MGSVMPNLWAKTRMTLEMIKWEHSIFALPFALTATILAAHGMPALRTLLWILVAMVAARSCAMAFNRWADSEIDAANPRTRTRAIPAGLLTREFVLGFTILMGALFVVASAALNRLTLILSPLVLIVLLSYSYMKRLTRWSHLVLGLALGLAPSAAWIAVRGSLAPRILVLTAAVTLWVGGFDVLYACQDYEHDSQAGLHSLPRYLGISGAFWAARLMHVAMLGLLIWFGHLFGFHVAGWLGVAAVGLLLGYEHSIVSPGDMRRLNAAFFTMNGVIAMVFLVFVAADMWLRGTVNSGQ